MTCRAFGGAVAALGEFGRARVLADEAVSMASRRFFQIPGEGK